MSLIESLALSPRTGVSMVAQFDKTTGQFYLLPPVGQGAWMHLNEFTILWIGDIVQYRTASGIEQLGMVTHLDFDDWSIEVASETGETGYPLSSNVICVVGRDMPTLTTAQQRRVSANLARLFMSKVASIVKALPAIAGGR